MFLDQLERDVLRAQGAEGNLTDKYQVGSDPEMQSASFFLTRLTFNAYFSLSLFCRRSRASAYSMK